MSARYSPRSKIRALTAALFVMGLSSGGAHAAASTLEVGCPWIEGSDVETKNTGFPETNATYGIISIPVNPGPQVHYVVRGFYPRVRYFGFQSYDGFRPGNLIDSLPDSFITPLGGNPPAANPAVLPDNGDYENQYEIEIRYAMPPANPADRLPNVLYAGLDSERGALTKQVVYRTYLKNPGSNRLGGRPRPSVTYVGPRGEIDLEDTPEPGKCQQLKEGTEGLSVFPVVGFPTARPKWKPVGGADQYVYYPNGNINYLKVLFAARYADLLLVRARAPVTPVLPPLVIPDPDVRYWSLCQNQLANSAVVACIADREMKLQPDGWVNIVIAKAEKRPSNARREIGYNFLPHGPSDNAVAGFRQLLVNPAFEGDYAKSVAQPSVPVGDVLGDWAPLVTYCDRGTFDSHAGEGGAQVFAACQAAYRPWTNLGLY